MGDSDPPNRETRPSRAARPSTRDRRPSPANDHSEKYATVIGIGNLLLTDDGLGITAVRMLQSRVPASVRVVDGGLISPGNLVLAVEDASRLLIIDAVDLGHVPGEVVMLKRTGLAPFPNPVLSPHQLSVADALALAALRGTEPEEVVVLGIQPARLFPGVGLSPDVKRALPKLVDRAEELLEGWITTTAGWKDSAPGESYATDDLPIPGEPWVQPPGAAGRREKEEANGRA